MNYAIILVISKCVWTANVVVGSKNNTYKRNTKRYYSGDNIASMLCTMNRSLSAYISV